MIPEPLAEFDTDEWSKKDFTERVRIGTNLYVLKGLGYPLAAYLFHAVKLSLFVLGWVFFCRFTPGLGTVPSAVAELTAGFGERLGASLHARAWFRDESPVTTSRAAKSRSTETTFERDVGDRGMLERTLVEQARHLAREVRARGIRGRTIAIKVRLDDFSTRTRARTLPEATDDGELIAQVALALLAADPPPRPVRLVGVRLAALEPDGAPHAQQALAAS